MLFLPGYTGTFRLMCPKKITDSFAKKYRVIFLELPMIHSEDHLFTIDEITEYINSFVKQHKIKKFELIGFSLSGPISVAYASKHPSKVTRVTLLCSSPSLIRFEITRNIALLLKPVFVSRFVTSIVGLIRTSFIVNKLMRNSFNKNMIKRIRKHRISIYGTEFNIAVLSYLKEYKKLKSKRAVYFTDDAIVRHWRYMNFFEKDEIVIFLKGGHDGSPEFWQSIQYLF